MVDEYGEAQAWSPQDVMEAITGEFKPKGQRKRMGDSARGRSWLLDGNPGRNSKTAFPSRPYPEERERYHTLATAC